MGSLGGFGGSRRGGAAVAAVALLLAGCGVGHAAASRQANQKFLAEVHSDAPDINSYRDNATLEGLGHAACNGFAAGASYQQLADRLVLEEGSHPLPSEYLGVVISAAVDAYCPRYRDLTG